MRVEEFISRDALKEKIANEGKIVIRPSSITQFISCPAQWFRASVLTDYRRPSAAASAGTSLHKGVEVGYREKIVTGQVPPVSYMTDAAIDEFKEILENSEDMEFGEDENLALFETHIVKGIKDYHANIMPDCNPVGVETRYTIPIESEVVDSVSGTIDIDLDNGLADVKMMNKNKSADMYVAQQSCYALLKQFNGQPCDTAMIHKVIRGKTAESVPLALQTEWVRNWVNVMLDTLESFYETGNTNLFRGSSPQSNFLCNAKWCGFWDKCPFVKHLK